MATHATTVEMTVHSELVESWSGETGAVPVTLAYTADEPYSVHLHFHGEIEATWEISRELLRDALERSTAGHGDVRTVNLGPNVLLTTAVKTSTRDEAATFLFDRRDLRVFLRSTAKVVDFGDEVLDFGAELDALLSGGAR